MASLLVALLVAGLCAGEAASPPLRINDIQVVGTHNSYKLSLPPTELAAHRTKDPAGADSIDYGYPPLPVQLAAGMRGVELDVWADPRGGHYIHPPGALRTGYSQSPWTPAQAAVMARPGFKVMHLADIDFRSSCISWIECLQALRMWSDAHPRHLPILVLVNAKDDPPGPGSVQPFPFDEAAFDRLDAETRRVFHSHEVITPDEVQGHYPTVQAAVRAGHWPTLEQARGRFLFVLDEGPRKVAAYQGSRRSLEGREMFVSVDETAPAAGILVINDPIAERTRIEKAVADGFIVRTRADADTREARTNDTRRREAALASGAQYVSTDYFRPDLRFSAYQVGLPSGGAGRANPISAPAGCSGTLPEGDAQQEPDVLLLRGSVTGEDRHSWRLVPFDVPAGTIRITVDFDYTTRNERTTIDLGLLGPDGFRGQDGFRGWSGGNKKSFTISATEATPSYLPGPITAGHWNLLLGIPNIRPSTRAEFTATVRLEPAAAVAAGTISPPAPPIPRLRSGQGWYRGDLHMHTAHSDGSCRSRRSQKVPCPLFLTAQTAADRGLDFIAITDHNTISHADAIRELQPYFDDVLLIPGREVTTFQGHANVFGTFAPVDFRLGSGAVPDWNTLLTAVADNGGILSINHPIRPSGEDCMGCGWRPEQPVDYNRVRAVEVVNGLDAGTPFSGIPFWQDLLNQGYRITAIGGSDNHDALERSSGVIGVPLTAVFASGLSTPEIIDGLRRGRVFIDLEGASTRTLELAARYGRQTAQMGDELRVRPGKLVQLKAATTGVTEGELEIILDGYPVKLLENAHIDARSPAIAFAWRADGRRHWLRLNVRDPGGHLILMGNPIYVSPSDPPRG